MEIQSNTDPELARVNNLRTIEFEVSRYAGSENIRHYIKGVFSLNHSASSYGLPIALIEGQPYSHQEICALLIQKFPEPSDENNKILYPEYHRLSPMSILEHQRWDEMLKMAGYKGAFGEAEGGV